MKLNKKNLIILIMGIIFFIILIFSIFKIICWFIDNKSTNKQIEDLTSKVIINEIEDNDNTEIINHNNDKGDPYWDYINTKLVNVDYNDLKKINNDVVGWIKVNGTNVNYPFVQTNNNKYYLTHSFDKSNNQAGWVFLDYRNTINKDEQNTIIYAHGRINNTMFGSLKNTIEDEWLNDTDNHLVTLSTEYENSLWQVFSIYKIEETSDYIQTVFNSALDYKNFLNLIKNRSIYNFNTSIEDNDRIITLSTCYNNKERLVLHAKLIKREVK